MTMRARRVVSKEAGDKGLSLIELIVSMGLSALVLTMVVGFFVQITSATVTANDSRNSTATASNIANELSDVIRPAAGLRVSGAIKADPAIIVGSPVSLTIYSNINKTGATIQPVRVSFYLNAQKKLVEERWESQLFKGLWIFPNPLGAPTSRRVLPGILVDPVTAAGAGQTEKAPLFQFLDSASRVVVPSGPGQTLTLTQRNSVASIQFTVRTRTESSISAKPVAIQNTVNMPNLVAKED